MDPITLSAFNRFAALANVNDDDRVVLSNGDVGVDNIPGMAIDVKLSPSEIAEQNAAVRQALYESVGTFVSQNGAFDPDGEVVARLKSLIGETEEARAKDLTARDIREVLRIMRTTDAAFDANVRTAEALARTDRGGYEKFFALVENSGKDIAALLGKAGEARFATVLEDLRRVPSVVNGLDHDELAALSETLADMSDLALAKISKPPAALSEEDQAFLEALQTASFKMALELDEIAEKGNKIEATDESFTRRAMTFNTAFARIEADAAAAAEAGKVNLDVFDDAVTRLSDELAAFLHRDPDASFVVGEDNPVAGEITERIELISDRLKEFKEALADPSKTKFLSELVTLRKKDFVTMLMAGEISPRQYLELRDRGYTAEMILKGLTLEDGTSDLGQGAYNVVVRQDASNDAVHTSRTFAVKDESEVSDGCAAAFLGLPEMSGAKVNFAEAKLANSIGSGDVIAKSGVALYGGTVKICMELVKGKDLDKFLVRFDRPTSSTRRLFHPDPTDAKAVARAEKLRLQLVAGLNRLVWADAFSGEVDRHLGNVMVHVNLETETVSVVGIDNEQGFAPNCVGLSKAVYSQQEFGNILRRFVSRRAQLAAKIRDAFHEQVDVSEQAFLKLFTRNADGTFSPNYSRKLTAGENFLLSQTCGINSSRTPAFIMKDQLDRLLRLEGEIAKWRNGNAKDNLAAHPLVHELFPILMTGRNHIDRKIFKALVSRADSMIAHAKKLQSDGLVVYGDAEHKATDLAVMKRVAKANKNRNDIDCHQSLDLAEIMLKRLV